ncbi:MAG: fibrobacter succinogenes major paralogous domain-containing protein, partial [Draconibacterium sp.]|nr:fibrobacter succinogenes major paralogous domain-containing protein [Draconibacterium sp.]
MTKNNRIWIYSFIVIGILIMTASSCEKMDTTEYESVTIGTQVWMLKNLNVTTYRNGDAIYNVTDNTEWRNLTTGAYCDYENSSIKADTYGRLYNWYAINDSRNIAPTGWHVATDGEWTTLINYLGGLNLAGGKLKEIGTSHWNTPNIGATNESGFTALPGGYRHYDGGSYDLKNMGSFWSSSEASPYNAWSYYL